jgi:hypothetical protein
MLVRYLPLLNIPENIISRRNGSIFRAGAGFYRTSNPTIISDYRHPWDIDLTAILDNSTDKVSELDALFLVTIPAADATAINI